MEEFDLTREEVLARKLHLKPLYLVEAERQAMLLEMPIEEILKSFESATSRSTYPTKDCLWPDELREFQEGEGLSEKERLHIEDCPACYMLFHMSRPLGQS